MFDSLNPQQRRGAEHPDGPLLIVAGAGTGKTMTLAARVAALIDRGVPPQRILLLTFTRRAAREMLGRAARAVGRDAAGRVVGGTFHGVANRLLRGQSHRIGMSPSFTIIDQTDAADLIDLVRDETRVAEGAKRFPRKDTLAAIYSRAVNTQSPLQDVLDNAFPWCREETDGIRTVIEGYVRRKREHDVLDYDDLLLYWRAAATSSDLLGRLFDHILVDEYQDTNALQADIVVAMARSGNCTAVGDDAQAIYAFRSATVRNILEFPDRFPGTTVVTLERNYRSTGPILRVANGVMAQARTRYTKTLLPVRTGDARPSLWTCADEGDQADSVCASVLEHRERGTPLMRQAVLFRATHHSDLLELELSRRNIPFVKYGGLKFLESAHVKDLMSCLRILENPADEAAWFRVLLLLEGIGPATARRLLASLGVRPRAAFDAAALDEVPTLRDALQDCASVPLGAQVERLRAFLEPIVERRYDAAPSRVRDFDVLATIAASFTSREAFLSDLVLDPPLSTGDLAGPPHLDEDFLILSTIHSAKGCEWDVVHVIHAADGMIPSDLATGDAEEVEEERRLFYVALTRARDALHVYFPLRYHYRKRPLDDAHGYAQRTRFLTPEVVALFDEHASTPAACPTLEVDGFLAKLFE